MQFALTVGKIRTVVIPVAEGVGQTTESPFWRDLTTEQKLDHILYGQNDFQAVANHCSVSVGDIIRLEGKRYRVDVVGFTGIPESAPTIQESPSEPRRWHIKKVGLDVLATGLTNPRGMKKDGVAETESILPKGGKKR